MSASLWTQTPVVVGRYICLLLFWRRFIILRVIQSGADRLTLSTQMCGILGVCHFKSCTDPTYWCQFSFSTFYLHLRHVLRGYSPFPSIGRELNSVFAPVSWHWDFLFSSSCSWIFQLTRFKRSWWCSAGPSTVPGVVHFTIFIADCWSTLTYSSTVIVTRVWLLASVDVRCCELILHLHSLTFSV